jgi:hypothetical protein
MSSNIMMKIEGISVEVPPNSSAFDVHEEYLREKSNPTELKAHEEKLEAAKNRGEIIKHKPEGGDISAAALDAVKAVQEKRKPVVMTFNEVELYVDTDDFPEDVEKVFEMKVLKLLKDEENDKDIELNKQQEQLDDLVDNLRGVIEKGPNKGDKVQARLDEVVDDLPEVVEEGHMAVMNWLLEYLDSTYDVEEGRFAKDMRFNDVIASLEEAGYSHEKNSFDPDKVEVTSDIVAHYVAGNVLSAIKGLGNYGPKLPRSHPVEQGVEWYREVKFEEEGGHGSEPDTFSP